MYPIEQITNNLKCDRGNKKHVHCFNSKFTNNTE